MVSAKTSVVSVLALSLIALIASLFAGTGFAASLVIWVAINILLAASFRFVQLIGELNFALAGFVGLGAYISGICTAKLGLPFAIALMGAAVAATLLSQIVGFITLRTKGPYFMLISFAFTEVLRMIYTQIEYIGGNSGMIGIFPPALFTDYYRRWSSRSCSCLYWCFTNLSSRIWAKCLWRFETTMRSFKPWGSMFT